MSDLCFFACGVFLDAGLSVPGLLLSGALPWAVPEGAGMVVEGPLVGGGFLAGTELSSASPWAVPVFCACTDAKGTMSMAEIKRVFCSVFMFNAFYQIPNDSVREVIRKYGCNGVTAVHEPYSNSHASSVFI